VIGAVVATVAGTVAGAVLGGVVRGVVEVVVLVVLVEPDAPFELDPSAAVVRTESVGEPPINGTARQPSVMRAARPRARSQLAGQTPRQDPERERVGNESSPNLCAIYRSQALPS